MRGVTVYIDLLFVLNCYVTWLLLLSAARLTGLRAPKYRVFLSSLLGGAISCAVFFADWTFWVLLPIKLLSAALLCAVAFGVRPPRKLWKSSAAFFGCSFVFAGAIVGILMAFSPAGVMIQNTVVYFAVSPILVAGMTLVCFLVLSAFELLAGRGSRSRDLYDIEITVGDNRCRITALCDSGNALCDGFSGTPVIVTTLKSVSPLMPHRARLAFLHENPTFLGDDWKTRVRVLPFSAVGKKGLLLSFRPDRTEVFRGGKSLGARSALIAVGDTGADEFDGIFNPKLLGGG